MVFDIEELVEKGFRFQVDLMYHTEHILCGALLAKTLKAYTRI